MKTTIVILMVVMGLILSACTTRPGEQTTPKETAEVEEAALTGCAALPTLQATLATKKQTLEEEQKELLMEKDARIQRLQKFKVLKLDREVKALEVNITKLQTEC